MRARLVVLIGLLAVAGCSTRDRINPFDPGNGNTAGRPAGFEALAGNQSVQLRWQAAVGEGLIGYQIFRRTADESEEQPITGTLSIATTQYIDRSLLNGLDHHYSLYYVFDRGPGPEPATDVATPGPRIPWMVDYGGALCRLTADGRRVAERRTLSNPVAVAADSISHHVWASDDGSGQVAILDSDTGIFTTVPRLFVSPGDIATQGDSSAWVCDEGRPGVAASGRVIHLDSRGGLRLPTLDNLDRPTGVAIDPSDGSVWVCERDGDRVLRYAASGVLLDSAIVVRPSRVAVDPVTHEAWVTSATQQVVHRIAPDGTIGDSYPGFAEPVGIEVDARRGRIWIADPGADRVTVLQRDGSVVAQIPNLPGALALAIDHETGEAWVACAGSSRPGEVVWLSPTGSVIRRLGGFSTPYGIAVLP